MKKTFKHNQFTAVFSDLGTGENNRYFSFTGTYDGGSGACGDRIVEIYPAFKIFNDLHLAKLTGEPMHALENGFYYFKESGWKVEALEDYWGVKLSDKQRKKCRNGIISGNESVTKKAVESVMEEIKPIWAEKVKAAYTLAKNTPSDLTEIDESDSIDDYDEPEKVRALADWLGVHFSTITEEGLEYTAQGKSYNVYTEEEADTAWEEELENYLEECVLPEIPEHLQNYFDGEKWIEAAKGEGRAHSLGRENGREYDLTDPETKKRFVAYRIN